MKISDKNINSVLDYYMGKLDSFVGYVTTDDTYDAYGDIKDLFELGFNNEPDELVERLENKEHLVRKYRELIVSSMKGENYDKELLICRLREMSYALDRSRPKSKGFVFGGFGR